MKKFEIGCIAAFSIASTFVGCSDFDYESHYPTHKVDETRESYTKSFTEITGGVAPETSWLPATPSQKGQTRADVVSGSNYYKIQDGIDKLPIEFQDQVPAPLTQEEKDYVIKYVGDHPNEGGLYCDVNTYFVQNVGGCFETYWTKDMNGAKHYTVGSEHMDYVQLDDRHILDYNAVYGPDALVVNVPIENPSYRESYSDQTQSSTRCLILMSAIAYNYAQNKKDDNTDNTVVTYDNQRKYDHYRFYYIPGYGMYLCFDWCTKKGSSKEEHPGDGRYNDWIIKIVPAYGHRVMCEDLGTTDDMDFNDVVFCINANGKNAYIRLEAAGGTLPLYLGESLDYEVHDLFQVEQSIMVNTGKAVRPEVYFKVPFKGSVYDFPIQVINKSLTQQAIRLKADAGAAPEYMFVKPSTRWALERESFFNAYPKFADYVRDGKTYWEDVFKAEYLY